MFYRNVSTSIKTFHGVTFKPGEAKEVNDYINHKLMIRVNGLPEDNKDKQKPSCIPKKEAKPEVEAKPVEEKKVETESKQEDAKKEAKTSEGK